jgi:DNA-binding NarL/FixJ family response regulator
MSIRVIIADDHPVVREGLRLMIERSGRNIVIVGEASDGMEVLEMARTKPTDVFILDITMPRMNGIETARELVRKFPRAKIIMLSLHDTKAMVEAALAAGAHGFLTKETATQNMIQAVSEVYARRFYLCPCIAHYVVEASLMGRKKLGAREAAPAALTAQERKVLQLIAEGQSNKEMAGLLRLAVNTVHVHRNRIMAKLNLHKQADLIRYAIKAGIAKL